MNTCDTSPHLADESKAATIYCNIDIFFEATGSIVIDSMLPMSISGVLCILEPRTALACLLI